VLVRFVDIGGIVDHHCLKLFFISWRPVLVVEEAGVPAENHQPWASNWKTLSLAAASRVHSLCNLQSRVRTRGVTIHFFHKRYVSRYLICITIRFIGNCNYSLKSMLVDMFFFLYDVAYVLAEIINI
jgi:hypothetical protein